MRSGGERDLSPITEAVILAGGLGTRLRTAVSDLPKPMAPVAGRPFLCYLLDQLAAQGVQRAILSVGYRWEAISAYFGEQYRGIAIEYAVEREPLGTGGGLSASLERAATPLVLTMNGDSFHRFHLDALSGLLRDAEPGSLAMAVCQLDDASRYGRVEMDGNRICGFLASGTPGRGIINAGVYLLPRDLFHHYRLPARFSFEADFLQPRVAELRPYASVTQGAFIDIGIPSSFEQAQSLLPLWTAE
jgi:D-glycero-alpha-D-manno-heptose 1-phosphate guanylyltransferase